MNAKRLLEGYNNIPFEIESLELQIKEEKELAKSIKSIDYSKDRVQVSTGNEAEFERRIHRAWELEEKYLEKIDKFRQKRILCEDLIEQVTNPNERLALKYKYLNKIENITIAEKMDISRQWVDTLVGRGLSFIQQIIEKKQINL